MGRDDDLTTTTRGADDYARTPSSRELSRSCNSSRQRCGRGFIAGAIRGEPRAGQSHRHGCHGTTALATRMSASRSATRRATRRLHERRREVSPHLLLLVVIAEPGIVTLSRATTRYERSGSARWATRRRACILVRAHHRRGRHADTATSSGQLPGGAVQGRRDRESVQGNFLVTMLRHRILGNVRRGSSSSTFNNAIVGMNPGTAISYRPTGAGVWGSVPERNAVLRNSIWRTAARIDLAPRVPATIPAT